MRPSEIRELSTSEVEKQLRDTTDELLRTRLRKETGQIERPHLLREMRRDIARLKTILAENKRTSN
jgi:large subunit ribosomal protein L29